MLSASLPAHKVCLIKRIYVAFMVLPENDLLRFFSFFFPSII